MYSKQDEIENATDEPTSGVEWSRGIFVSASDDDEITSKSGDGTKVLQNNKNRNKKQEDTSRIDTGTTSTITDKFTWMKNRHKWEWWQKARQPRQPWSSPLTSRRRRRRRRRRLLNIEA